MEECYQLVCEMDDLQHCRRSYTTLHTAYRTSQEVFEVFTVSALIQK